MSTQQHTASRVRQLCSGLFACIVLAGVLVGCTSQSSARIINLYNAPQENLAKIVDRCNTKADGRYRIVLNTLPRDADSQREQLVRRLAAGDSGMDVLGIDVTWTAELASAKWILPWPAQQRKQAQRGVLPAPLKTAMYEDKMYAAPYNTNVQLLWYRDDLMPKPAKTWDELIETATKLADQDKPHYAEVTGAQFEGLVVWFNSLLASGDGSILNSDVDKVKLGQPAINALKQMKRFATSPAANPSLSNTQEDQARLAVESGSSFAELNWPFVYAAMEAKPEIAKHFKWAPYPGIDGVGNAPLGGANFAVSKYSQNSAAAFDAALCLRDPQSQLQAALKDGLPPTIKSVYSKPEMGDAYPMRNEILDALKTAVPRPVTPVYQNVSTVTSALLSPPSSIDAEPTEQAMSEQIANALESKGVLP